MGDAGGEPLRPPHGGAEGVGAACEAPPQSNFEIEGTNAAHETPGTALAPGLPRKLVICAACGWLLAIICWPVAWLFYKEQLQRERAAAEAARFEAHEVQEFGLYRSLTGRRGHVLPEMYGQVKEKTIWIYWNSGENNMPPLVQLCLESVRHNRGSFDVVVMSEDDVDKYVSRAELPFQWDRLTPQHQKDSLMNALLARYGGVALDATIILFEPLDAMWNEMRDQKALFRGYVYEFIETCVWFLMARREGIFRIAVTSQIIGMGDDTWPSEFAKEHDQQYLGLGDRTVTPILCMFERSLCKPLEDAHGEVYPPDMQKAGSEPLGYASIQYTNPRMGPELPYAFMDGQGMPLWDITTKTEEWAEFIRRFLSDLPEVKAPFVKMFGSGGRAKKLTRKEFLSMKSSFLCHWLCLSGTNPCDVDCPERKQARLASQDSEGGPSRA